MAVVMLGRDRVDTRNKKRHPPRARAARFAGDPHRTPPTLAASVQRVINDSSRRMPRQDPSAASTPATPPPTDRRRTHVNRVAAFCPGTP